MRFFTATVGNNRRVSFWEQRVSPILEVVTSTTHLLKSKHSDQILKPIINNKRCRSLLHCAEGIWKRSYISKVRPTGYTNLSRKWSFSKTLFKPEGIWQSWLFVVVWTSNRTFRKRWRHDNHVIPLPQFSSNTNPDWPVVVAFPNSSSVVGSKTFDVFSERNLRFQITPASCGRGLRYTYIKMRAQ